MTSAVLHMLHPLECSVGALGVTVRNGPKWADFVKPGDKIILCVCTRDPNFEPPTGDTHEHAGTAEVVSADIYMFRDVPARLIELEHEVSSRMYSGLYNSMKRAYGPSFRQTDIVTVLTYRRLT